jgi:hypothetical protein
MLARLANRVARSRQCLSRLKQRSTTLRRRYISWSKSGGRPAGTSFDSPADDLIHALGNCVPDPPPAQRPPGRVVRIALVGDQHVRPLPRQARTAVVHPDRIQDRQQLRVVTGLARCQPDRQRPATAIDRQMDLRTQPAAGPADRLTIRRRGRKTPSPPFFRAPAAC